MSSDEEKEIIELEFVQSWERMEKFYGEIVDQGRWLYLAKLKHFLVQLRSEGYDRQLRAGQSMTTFIVSRSRKHGLRREQPFMRFMPYLIEDEVVMDVDYFGIGEATEQTIMLAKAQPLMVTQEIRDLLNRLVNYPID